MTQLAIIRRTAPAAIPRVAIPLDWWRGFLCIYGTYGAGRMRWLAQHEARDQEQRTRLTAALERCP